MTVDRTALDNVFGTDTVAKWADLQNMGDSGHIATRVAWAIALATKYVRSQMRSSNYNWVEVSTDELVEHAIALKAGMLLYGNRSVTEIKDAKTGSPMAEFRRAYDDFFKGLSEGTLTLGDETTDELCRPYPGVYRSELDYDESQAPYRARPVQE